MNREARPIDRLLDPAQKKLRPRLRPSKAANVMAEIENTRKAQAMAHAQIIPERLPVCGVVAGPGLRIALQAGAARARDEERPLRRGMPGLREGRCAEHQSGLHGAQGLHRTALPVKAHTRAIV